ncbi:MAG: tripartite tricarboxylate transporter substrate binding protein [Betaproteobacteria bacterium]|nr:tripartite tricarboxylate transporter substrate binding protein [Betaproteobacteria bacterium]NBT75089.1 tripartite tricarboxylate transporter substrate binding protein [Betaproteobacteria bacterium]NCA16243.1 tripartite tricarboxylate transporter substrate binding protein [Betaproteobacteria bacterium]NDF03970.1 tripartite tricarboxylate transporter substrate binding protein [Betaproteobacteria bacterium]
MLTRRTFLSQTTMLGVGAGLPLQLFAQGKPFFDTINLFIPANPGGGWDGTGRAIEEAAKKAGLVGTFQFENVGGAGGMVGLPRFVNTRKGQGNSLMVGGAVMVGAAITNKSPVTMKDVTPVARLTEEAGVIVVPTNGKIQSWKDLEAALRANPKAVSVAGGSAGGTDHQLLGLLVKALGKNPREAAYVAFPGGGPANAAIIGGQVTAGISGYSEFEEQLKAGRMKAIAVSGNKRIPGVDVPTLLELGVQVSSANWRGIFGPPAINEAQRAKLEEFATKLHASEPWKDMLVKRKWTDVFLTGKAFAKEIEKSVQESEMVLKDLGLAA